MGTIEELSEIVQNLYQVFAKRMEASIIYTGKTSELLIKIYGVFLILFLFINY
jgi:hypothetical protein